MDILSRAAKFNRMALLVLAFCLCSGFSFPAAHAAPPADFTELAKNAGPAVVNISTERVVKRRPGGPFMFPSPFFGGPGTDEFERFFEQFDGPRQQEGGRGTRRQNSLGSGFVISSDGYVVTNNHVVKGADVIKVNFYSSKGNKEDSYEAEIIGTDEETDLALLKISANRSLPVLKFGDSDALEVGSWVVAIGNPFGLDHTVTAGILSAKWRKIGSGPFDDFLQTDASINPGNSGGPLLNMDGEVVGINTAIVPQGQGLGFAIPSSTAKKVIEDLKANKKVTRGWIGVTIQDVDENSAKALGLPEAGGALVGGVVPGDPADKAGIGAGDVILKVGDAKIASSDDLLRAIAALKPNSTTSVTIWREGKTSDVNVTLGERNADKTAENGNSGKQTDNASVSARLGLSLRTLSESDAAQLGLDIKQGVLVAGVNPDSVAAESGFRRGDVIFAVGRTAVKNLEDFNKLASEADKSRGVIMLQVNRRGQSFIRSMEIPKLEGKK